MGIWIVICAAVAIKLAVDISILTFAFTRNTQDYIQPSNKIVIGYGTYGVFNPQTQIKLHPHAHWVSTSNFSQFHFMLSIPSQAKRRHKSNTAILDIQKVSEQLFIPRKFLSTLNVPCNHHQHCCTALFLNFDVDSVPPLPADFDYMPLLSDLNPAHPPGTNSTIRAHLQARKFDQTDCKHVRATPILWRVNAMLVSRQPHTNDKVFKLTFTYPFVTPSRTINAFFASNETSLSSKLPNKLHLNK
ncbi:hypothetical protein DSO57_1005112 [Entomophthora muscae]|uniref:Uncharacterized protein n=1 Tax=Entomophthora muscae TaxID=34485 RepID=A0ACC2SA42_9FUNG|nr:hypothetical protein DSO57_1005112 [Entomophthora muscae]